MFYTLYSYTFTYIYTYIYTYTYNPHLHLHLHYSYTYNYTYTYTKPTLTLTFTSTVTGEKYKIDGKYNCETSNCIYLVTCGICDVQYIGKTSQAMRKRHGLHRSHIKANRYGLGSHFFKHAASMMQTLKITQDYGGMNIILEREQNQKQ